MKTPFVVSLLPAILLSLAAQAQSTPATNAAPTPTQQMPLWGALAVELTTSSDPFVRETVARGVSRKRTRAEAEATALQHCRTNSTNPQNCRLEAVFNEGCKYLATGELPWGKSGWAIGPSPQAAYDACHAKGFNCSPLVPGGCAKPADDYPVGKIVKAPEIPYWLALAAGSRNDDANKYLSVSAMTGPSKEAAEQRAVNACNSRFPNGEVSCQAVGSFNTGCGYITRSYSSPGRNPLGWALGRTPEEAYDRCKAMGYSCRDEPVGACIRE